MVIEKDIKCLRQQTTSKEGTSVVSTFSLKKDPCQLIPVSYCRNYFIFVVGANIDSFQLRWGNTAKMKCFIFFEMDKKHISLISDDDKYVCEYEKLSHVTSHDYISIVLSIYLSIRVVQNILREKK